MQLYELVQSMTTSERRYFKSYTKSGTIGPPPKYLLLFDVLCKATSYNEKKIAKKGFTYDDRNLLMEKILEALHVHYGRKSIDAEIRLLISQAEVLFKKNIYDEMDKRLKRAKKLAVENERLLYLLQVMELQINVANSLGNLDLYKHLKQEQKRAGKKQLEEIHYVDVDAETSIMYLEDVYLENPENLERFERITDNSIFIEPSLEASALTKISYYSVQFKIAQFTKNKVRTTIVAKKIIELVDENPHLFIGHPTSITRVYLFMRKWLEKYDVEVIDTSYSKFMKTIDTFAVIPLEARCIIYCAQIGEYITTLNKVQGEILIQNIINKQNVSNATIGRQMELYYAIMLFYGTFEDWEKSYLWLRRTLSFKRWSVFKIFQFKARFYGLIIHYERGTDDFLKHVQSLQRHLKRNNHQNDLEQKVLRLMEDLAQTIRHSDKIKVWQNLYDVICNESELLHYAYLPSENFKQWCKSKIESVSITKE